MHAQKTFLVDLDGVVLHRDGYFSERAKELYPNAKHKAIKDFFTKGLYKRVTLGEITLTEAMEKVYDDWGIDKPMEKVIKDWFRGEDAIDKKILAHIQTLRGKGIRCVIATDHSKHRAEYVWNELGMREYFDDIISSADVGATKEEQGFYTKAMERLGISDPSAVVFADDDPKNVEVATSLGIHGVIFLNHSSLTNIEW